jgi:putative membrane protein insertion efficiency factor
MLALCALAAADSFRAPERQLTSALYLRCVGWYQYAISPHIGGLVVCRYRPTCSTYSFQAVRRFGIRKGLWLTADRLARCRESVLQATADPVPPVP